MPPPLGRRIGNMRSARSIAPGHALKRRVMVQRLDLSVAALRRHRCVVDVPRPRSVYKVLFLGQIFEVYTELFAFSASLARTARHLAVGAVYVAAL